MTVAHVVGRTLVDSGIDTVFGVVGSGNFAVTNAMVAAGAASWVWTSRGRFSRTTRRSATAVRTAAAACSAAPAADVTRRGTAPTAAARAAWSTAKFERGAVASAARTTRGVRLLAASVTPVRALVRPEPWCTVTAACRALIRAWASGIYSATQ